MSQNPTFTLSDADRAAVAGVPQRIVDAWAKHDADAFAAVFTEDATMILPGVLCQGQDEIRTFMAAAFSGPYRGTRVTGTPVNLRAIDDETAVIVTQGGVTDADATEVPADRAVRATWVVVKRQGTWQLAAYQNTPATAPAAA